MIQPVRRRSSRAAAVLVVAVWLTLMAATVPPGDARAEAAAQAPADDVRHLTVLSQSAFVDAGDPWELVLSPLDVPPGAQLTLRIHAPIGPAGRLAFTKTLEGRSLGSTRATIGPIDVDSAVAFGGGSIVVAVPTSTSSPTPDGGVILRSEGVYPVEVELTDADGAALEELVTYLIRLPDPADATDAGPPLHFATVLPLQAPPALAADRTWSIPTEDLSRVDQLAETLATQPEVAVTVIPGPELLTALTQVAGGEAVLDSLREALVHREVPAYTWVPLDTGSFAEADIGDAVADELSVGATAAGDVLGAEVQIGTWLVDPTVSPDGLTALHAAGVEQLVIPERLLSPLDPELFDVTLTQPFEVSDGRGDVLPALAADAGLGQHLDAVGDPVLAAHNVFADLAVLSLDRQESPRAAALALDDQTVSPTFLRTLLLGLAEPHETPLVVASTVADVFEQVPAATEGGPDDTDDADVLMRTWRSDPPVDLGNYPEMRTETARGLAGYRSMVGEESDRWPPLDLLVQSSGDRRLRPPDREELLLTVQGVVGADTATISTPKQAVTLTSRQGTFPLQVDNGSGVAMEVRLLFRSDRITFPDGNELTAHLEPGPNRVEVRVRARTSGVFPVDVTVTSPDQVLELDQARLTVRSTAISGVGLVISIAIGFFLAVWWFRHIRAERRARRTTVEPATIPSSGRPSGA